LYLAYFDDSGSEPSSDLSVFGGVVINGDFFGHAEAWSQAVLEHVGIEPDTFEEFKASQLYYGNGAFDGCDKTKCREGFLILVNMLNVNRFPFIYSAVDRKALQQERLLASAHPVDVAFRMCLGQLELWARNQHGQRDGLISVRYEDMCVVIADECDGALKRQMLTTFRQKRQRRRIRAGDSSAEWLFHIHDSMYFGRSADSVGLQIADVANWTMHRMLTGLKTDNDILEQIRKVAICAKPDPDWPTYRRLFKDHADLTS
jgi:hypothetical protein